MTEPTRTQQEQPNATDPELDNDVEGHALLDADFHRPIVSTRSREPADHPQGCHRPPPKPTNRSRTGR
jgi:hypothetical protein